MSKQNRIAGVCYIKVGSEQVILKDGAVTADLKMFTKESVTGLNETVGYSEKAFTPFVEFEAATVREMDLQKLIDVEDVAITIELANGWVGNLQNAWHVGDATVSSEGSASLRFEGKYGEWIKS